MALELAALLIPPIGLVGMVAAGIWLARRVAGQL